MTYYLELEIDNEVDVPTIIDTTNRGVKLNLVEKANSGLEFLVRNLQAIAHLVHGKNCRVRFGTDPVKANNPVIFEGTMTDIDRSGTFQQYIPIFARDKFKDRCLSKIVNWGSEGEGGPATIAHYTFDSTFDDFGGEKNHGYGNFVGPDIFKNGEHHEGVFFNSTIANGNQDKVSVPHDKSMESGGSLWFSFWTVHGENPVVRSGIFGKGFHRGIKSGPFAYVEPDGKVTFGYGTGDKIESITSNTAGIMPENINGSYIHWVCEIDTLNKTMSMWSAFTGDLGPSKDLILRKTLSDVDPPYTKNKDPMLFGCLSLADDSERFSVHKVGTIPNNGAWDYEIDPLRSEMWEFGALPSGLRVTDLQTGVKKRQYARFPVGNEIRPAYYDSIWNADVFDEDHPWRFIDWKNQIWIFFGYYFWDWGTNTYFEFSQADFDIINDPVISATWWTFAVDAKNQRVWHFSNYANSGARDNDIRITQFSYADGKVTYEQHLDINEFNFSYSTNSSYQKGQYWENGDKVIFPSNDGEYQYWFYDPDTNSIVRTAPFSHNDYWFSEFDIDQQRDFLFMGMRGNESVTPMKFDLWKMFNGESSYLADGEQRGWGFYSSYGKPRMALMENQQLIIWTEDDSYCTWVFDYSEEAIGDTAKMPSLTNIHWADRRFLRACGYGPEIYGEYYGKDTVSGKFILPTGGPDGHAFMEMGGDKTQSHWYGKLDEFYWFNGKSSQQQREELHYNEVEVNGGADPFKETLERILSQIGDTSDFNGNGIEPNLENTPLNFPYWMGDEVFDDIAQSLGCTYYHRPDGQIDFFRENSRTSGLTITEDMVRDVGVIKNSIANSVTKVIVIGADDAEGNKIIGTSELSSPDTKIVGREKAVHDKTITSYARAKALAKFILRNEGKVTLDIPPLFIRNLDPLPNPTETIILNLPSVGLVAQEVTVREIEIKAEQGSDNIEWIKLSFGQKQLGVIERITKSEKREASTQRSGNNESQPTNIEQTSNIKALMITDTTFPALTEPTTTFDNIDGFRLDTSIGNTDAFGLDGGATQSELDV